MTAKQLRCGEPLRVDNPGTDWVALGSFTIPGIGTGVTGVSLRSDRYALARLQWAKPYGSEPKTITMPGLRDGTYELRQFDVGAGTEKDSRVALRGGVLAGYVPLALDEGIALFRK